MAQFAGGRAFPALQLGRSTGPRWMESFRARRASSFSLNAHENRCSANNQFKRPRLPGHAACTVCAESRPDSLAIKYARRSKNIGNGACQRQHVHAADALVRFGIHREASDKAAVRRGNGRARE
jgi:hypothetical protein